MKFLKNHRKGIIAIIVVAAIVVGGYFGLKSIGKKTMTELNKASVETATVERRDLVSVVSATGKIVSLESKTVSSTATGTKVLEVNVEVGDEVKKGDVLMVLDSSSIEKNLLNVTDSLENTKKSNNLQLSVAQRNYNDTVSNSQITMDRYSDQIEDSEKSLEDTKQLRDQAETLYKNAVTAKQNAQKAYDDAVKSLSTIKDNIKNAKQSVSGSDTSGSKTLKELSNDLEKTENLINSYKIALDAATQAESAQLANYQSYISSVENLEKSLESVKQNVSDSQRQNDSAIASSKDSLSSTKLSISGNTYSLESQIDSLNDQIEDCVIVAPFDGIVTSLNYAVGDTYSGMDAVTIEDVSGYEISTEIDEYDIGKIKVGQRVVVRTNGTADKEMEGVVKKIAPRASMGSSVTYNVIVSLLESDESIRLDMTAKMSIVLSSVEQSLTVPYDAVYTNGDGSKYIKVVDGTNEDGTYNTHDVNVTTGIETDYYTEIVSGDVKTGDAILVERQKSDVFNFSDMFGGSAMGGM